MGGGDTRAKQDHGGRGGKDDGETGQRETGGETRADETLFPEGAPQRHINWQDEGYELFVGYGHGASAIRVGELQEDPLTRFLLRYDEFETGGELRDGKGAQIKMGKDSEPLRSGKGRALNVRVAQTCLALHVSHQFTHFAATDGGNGPQRQTGGGWKARTEP